MSVLSKKEKKYKKVNSAYNPNPSCLTTEVKVAQLFPTVCNTMDYIVHGIPRPEYRVGQPFPSPGDLPNPGIKPSSPALQVDSLSSEPPGKPKNTGVGSLSLLQRIFPTQESIWSTLHCRQILYQLSYQGGPRKLNVYLKYCSHACYICCKFFSHSLFAFHSM